MPLFQVILPMAKEIMTNMKKKRESEGQETGKPSNVSKLMSDVGNYKHGMCSKEFIEIHIKKHIFQKFYFMREVGKYYRYISFHTFLFKSIHVLFFSFHYIECKLTNRIKWIFLNSIFYKRFPIPHLELVFSQLLSLSVKFYYLKYVISNHIS